MKTKKGKYVEGTVDEINALFRGEPMKPSPTQTHTLESTLRKDLAANWPQKQIENVVRAVNSHEELLTHLRTLEGILGDVELIDGLRTSEKQAVREARIAIAKAEGR